MSEDASRWSVRRDGDEVILNVPYSASVWHVSHGTLSDAEALAHGLLALLLPEQRGMSAAEPTEGGMRTVPGAQDAVLRATLEEARRHLPQAVLTRDMGSCQNCGAQTISGMQRLCPACLAQTIASVLAVGPEESSTSACSHFSRPSPS